MEEKTDFIRQLADLAISAGRGRQSTQTAYVHHCYHPRDEEGQHDTIPLYENFLFALSLFRLRHTDSIQEGRNLVLKLLAFQCKEGEEFAGNFPIYLHEYPQCKDRQTSAHFLVPVYDLLNMFGSMLGQELKQKLTDAARQMLDHAWRTHAAKPLPFQAAIKLAAVSKGLGGLWKEEALQEKGEALLAQLLKESEEEDFGTWFSPAYLADTWIALQIAYGKVGSSPWKAFFDHLFHSWDPLRCHYIGPMVKEFQSAEEPQVTLYDFLMPHLSGTMGYRAFINQFPQLHAILVRPSQDTWPVLKFPLHKEGMLAGFKWVIHQTPCYSYSAIQKAPLPNPALEKGFHPFFLQWGDPQKTFTFVCQGGDPSYVDFQTGEGEVDLLFDLAEVQSWDDREKSKEIQFYVEAHEDLKILVEEETATTFQLGQRILLEDHRIRLELAFTLEGGDGRFMGHLQPANRPAQIRTKGKHRFQTWDWMIALRTIRRFTPCRIKVRLKIQEKKKDEFV